MSESDLQFRTAEERDTRRHCTFCHSVLETSFYQIQGQDACASCAEQRRRQQNLPDDRRQFFRAVFYGASAAFAGLVIWSVLQIATGWQIGLIAVAVGWMVGTAIRNATKGHSSRKYQILAVVCTYLAISMSFLPLVIAQAMKAPASQGTPAPNQPVVAKGDEPGPAAGFLILVGVSLVSPFLEAVLDFPSGLLSVLILLFALQQAWSITKPDDAVISGPFELEQPG